MGSLSGLFVHVNVPVNVHDYGYIYDNGLYSGVWE